MPLTRAKFRLDRKQDQLCVTFTEENRADATTNSGAKFGLFGEVVRTSCPQVMKRDFKRTRRSSESRTRDERGQRATILFFFYLFTQPVLCPVTGGPAVRCAALGGTTARLVCDHITCRIPFHRVPACVSGNTTSLVKHQKLPSPSTFQFIMLCGVCSRLDLNHITNLRGPLRDPASH
jgi:hypothetical protein